MTLLVTLVMAVCRSLPRTMLLAPCFSPCRIMQQLDVNAARWQLRWASSMSGNFVKLQHSAQDGPACGMICVQRALHADDARRMNLLWHRPHMHNLYIPECSAPQIPG
jgi:hypothetical protein